MAVNHRRAVARLLCGQVLIRVQREVVGAKGVAQSVVFAGDFRLFAEFAIMFLKFCFFTRPKFATFTDAIRFKPRLQSRADFHKATLAGFAFARCDFNVFRHTPHVRPIQAQ